MRATDFEPGIPKELSFKFLTGKLVKGKFGDQFLFTTSDGALYLDHEPAHTVEEQLRAQAVMANEPVRIVRLKSGAFRVIRPATMEEQLQASVHHARTAAVPERYSDALARYSDAYEPPEPPAQTIATAQRIAAPPVATPAVTQMSPATRCMCASMCSAVDAVMETQAYASRQGLGLTFSEESVRAIGLSIYIDACRNGGSR